MWMCCQTDPGCEAGRHPGDSTEMGSSYGAPIISVIRFVASGVEGVVDLGTVSHKSTKSALRTIAVDQNRLAVWPSTPPSAVAMARVAHSLT